MVGAGEILDPGMARGFGRQILVYLALLTWETIATQSRDVLMIKVYWQRGVIEIALLAPKRTVCGIEDELYGCPGRFWFLKEPQWPPSA